MQDSGPREASRNYMLKELQSWNKNKRSSLTLLKENTCEDGRLLLKISIGPEKVFSLYCPVNYPLDEGNFFVETDSVNHLWCNSLNEFILDAPERLTLCAVLDKAASLDLSTVDSPCVSSDSEEENEEFMVLDAEDEEDVWEKGLWDKMKAWRIKEASVRGSLKAQDKPSFCRELNKKSELDQVFSKSAASGILTNDLVNIIRASKETGIEVEPVDDNIYEWCVRFSKFSPECQLYKDLQKLNERHKWNHIELHLRFSMDLYPFDPPVPHALWPRPEGSVRLIVACMDILKLSSWNPTRGMMSVLLEIKQYLTSYATLKVDTCLRQSNLLSIENVLLLLAFVSEIPPRCPDVQPLSIQNIAQGSSSSAASADSSRSFSKHTKKVAIPPISPTVYGNVFPPFKVLNLIKKPKKQGNTFPNGTGYSTHKHKGWDIQGFLAAKQEKDRKLECVMQQVLVSLRDYLKTVDENANPSNINRVVPLPGVTDSACGVWDPMTDLFEALNGSTLIPFLEEKLRVDSFVEINQHKTIYRCATDILCELVSRPWLISLISRQPGQEMSVCDLLIIVKEKAQSFLDFFNKAEKPDVKLEKGKKRANSGTRESSSRKMKEVPPSSADTSKPAAGSANRIRDSDIDEIQLAKDLCELSSKVERAFQKLELAASPLTPSSPEEKMQCGTSASASGSKVKDWVDPDKDLAAKYISALKDLQFLSCDIDDARSFTYWSALSTGYTPGRAVIMRIAQELSSLSTSLPLDLASAIFVRTDDSKCNIMKALIIGPEGTPYSGGCFLFDILFPNTYPKVPPQFSFRTTGRQKVRFNPNLYANGKVCLSLLGTWSGLQGEQWHETSTLLQVLVSIQSLILVSEPYFNEPGYENELGTSVGKLASLNYNHSIRYHTIMLGMVEQLKYPPPNFEDVVRTHFLIKGARIEKELEEYVKENPSAPNLRTAQKTLSEELNRLRRESTLRPEDCSENIAESID